MNKVRYLLFETTVGARSDFQVPTMADFQNEKWERLEKKKKKGVLKNKKKLLSWFIALRVHSQNLRKEKKKKKKILLRMPGSSPAIQATKNLQGRRHRYASQDCGST